MKSYQFKTAQAGFAAGCAYWKIRRPQTVNTAAVDAEAETAKLRAAIGVLGNRLHASMRDASEQNAKIFETSLMMLEDESFIKRMFDAVRTEGCSAESAVSMAGTAAAKEMSENESAYLRERSADITGLAGQLIECLHGDSGEDLNTPSIVIADELSPGELASLKAENILGLVTAKGADTSHVAIFAGNLGIPYIYGTAIPSEITGGDFVILNGDEGTLTVAPDDETRAAATARYQSVQKARTTADFPETKTRVAANISGPQDIPALLEAHAPSVGLFRSEFLFLDGAVEPSEDAQFEAYRSVVEAMNGREVVIRTMDIGSDKHVDWLRMPPEANPALGCRGLRVSLNHPEVFKKQLRALLRAAVYGNLRVMIPMIASVWELEEVRRQLDSAASELESEGIAHRMPEIGVMIETPAAVLIADALAQRSAFFSIGTNDLTQYTLAIDREAQGLDSYYDPCHVAVMRLIDMTVEAAHRNGIPVAICGELASNPDAIPRLIQSGVDELSVSIGKMQRTAALIRNAEQSAPSDDAAAGSDPARVPGDITSPADGVLISMENIPDPVFSAGTMGRCIAVMPENGAIYAPCSGTIDSIAATLHAVTFIADSGDRLLLHVGIDTVKLNGKGFQVLVREGDRVTEGQHIMDVDLGVLREAGLSDAVVVVWCD